MPVGLAEAVSAFGKATKAKLSSIAATGQPEDQLRAPFEKLLGDLATICGVDRDSITAVGESTVSAIRTRPDYAVSRGNALTGFVELKAPGKGADPRKFSDPHDKAQWLRLRTLPNLLYTDGNAFSLWQNGELVGEIIRLDGNVETSGTALAAPPGLTVLFSSFFQWQPIAPKTPSQLAEVSARLCRLLREEVSERLSEGNEALTDLKHDWRKLLFPSADDAAFADGYAQAVTFGLLMARSRDISLAGGLDHAAKALRKTNSLIGTALRLLTDEADNRAALKTSLDTLTRVLDVVSWPRISRGKPDAWLYFYEHFLSVYDSDLRRRTGSYYTPPEIVTAMVRLVDEALRDPARFAVSEGLASKEITVADPAVGTGTYLLAILRRIAATVAADQGEGAVPGAIAGALKRVIGFEMQFGPFSVAQLRLFAELAEIMGDAAAADAAATLRLYITDTLSNPAEEENALAVFKPITASRRAANRIKREEAITVVIGNPPYKEKAKPLGGWVVAGDPGAGVAPLIDSWMPPREWRAGAHAKHLHNLYVYFWRWAAWKVFESAPATAQGVVCFITVSGFLNGPGFQKMRADLRAEADEIWVIDCSPEGHQPEVATRVFQGVQHPVCIVLAARHGPRDADTPARVRFRALPAGPRAGKFTAVAELTLDAQGWQDCPPAPRAPFLPAAGAAWGDTVPLSDLFIYDGSGVMPGRTWVIAPDAGSLRDRWDRLVAEKDLAAKERLFHPHLVHGKPRDRHIARSVMKDLPGYPHRKLTVAADTGPVAEPVRYAFRSFDRQWIIPDSRLINQANPTLWALHGPRQVYLTALVQHAPKNGPVLTASALIPDLHHYMGSFGGRAFPLWLDRNGTVPNLRPRLLATLSARLGAAVTAPDLLAAVAALLAHPAYLDRFRADLVQPGLRVPLPASPALFGEAVALGREVLWLHTFGERYADGRPAGPPRLSSEAAPRIPKDGGIPPGTMPGRIEYDAAKQRLHVGAGMIENVPPAVWSYEVSGKPVLSQWFSYRRADRSRPLIGEKRPPSRLGEIQPDSWPAEYTTELMNLLHVLGRLVALEPAQADLLARVCAVPLVTLGELKAADAFSVSPATLGALASLAEDSGAEAQTSLPL